VNSLVFEAASGCLESAWLLSQDRQRRIARGRIVIHNVNESSCVLHGISFAQLPLTASSNSSNTGIAASLDDMQLTRHVALTPNHRLAPIRAEAISALLASAESCAETARVASSIGRQVLRRYSFDSDWVCLYGTLEEKNSESLCSTLPAILAIPLAVMPAISVCWPAIPSA